MHSKTNLVGIVDGFLRETKGEVKCFGISDAISTKINKILNGITDYERPDGYTIAENTVYIVEHFEFDSTPASKKGSASRIENGRINRTFDEAISKELAGLPEGFGQHESYINDSYDVSHSAGDYTKNAISNANNHYGKISEYVENLEQSNILMSSHQKRVGFFIEDKTLLGISIFNAIKKTLSASNFR